MKYENILKSFLTAKKLKCKEFTIFHTVEKKVKMDSILAHDPVTNKIMFVGTDEEWLSPEDVDSIIAG
jgi:hypothetical protein